MGKTRNEESERNGKQAAAAPRQTLSEPRGLMGRVIGTKKGDGRGKNRHNSALQKVPKY